MTRKHPENDNPNVQDVRELAGSGCCKERSDGIAIVTLCVNRVQSQSLFLLRKCFYGSKRMKNKKKPLEQQP